MAETEVRFEVAPDAEQVVEGVASPALPSAAQVIADSIPSYVPVHHGGAIRTYHTSPSGVVEQDGHPEARVWIDSPFWHFLEYGTQFNPPYRPIQNAVVGLGLRYEPT